MKQVFRAISMSSGQSSRTKSFKKKPWKKYSYNYALNFSRNLDTLMTIVGRASSINDGWTVPLPIEISGVDLGQTYISIECLLQLFEYQMIDLSIIQVWTR